jgi:prepilin-type N-terminal cleavage/methylation domain-containing protein
MYYNLLGCLAFVGAYVAKNPAFSLIELMVVVAIIAVLGLTAIVSYRYYIPKSRVTSLVPAFDEIMTKSIDYANEAGRFPTARELGYSADPAQTSNVSAIDPASISPYLTLVLTNDSAYGGSGTVCGQSNYVYAEFNTSDLGFDSSIDFFSIQCDAFNVGGRFSKQCWFEYGGSGGSMTDNFIPGWTNANTTSGWDASNYNDGWDALNAASSCMQ